MGLTANNTPSNVSDTRGPPSNAARRWIEAPIGRLVWLLFFYIGEAAPTHPTLSSTRVSRRRRRLCRLLLPLHRNRRLLLLVSFCLPWGRLAMAMDLQAFPAQKCMEYRI